MMNDTDLDRDYWSSLEVNYYFGIRERGISDYFPASALQGPFWALLRHHPRKAAAFIIELLNHAGDWYGRRRWPGHDLEPAVRITLDVPNVGQVEQWLNGRLFALYRGMTVGPPALQSILMALEKWLLDMAEVERFDLESWLLHVLSNSNNAMATGVVASLCVAYPARAGKASLAVLSSRELLQLDKQRLANERMNSVEFFSGLNPSHEIYEDERRKANSLPHRREDLESVAIRLQLTDLREDVWKLIDNYRAALSEKDEETLVWRLALHRMDVRGYGPIEAPAEVKVQAGDHEGHTYLGPSQLEPEVERLVSSSKEKLAELNRDLALENAAHAAWENGSNGEATGWRALLSDARELAAEGNPVEHFMGRGPGIVAAVCIRDYLTELNPQELAWCADRVVRELLWQRNADEMAKHSRMFGPDRAAAAVAPLLVARAPQALQVDPTELLVQALAHPVEEVTEYAYMGAGVFLGMGDGDTVLRCASAAVGEAQVRDAARSAERTRLDTFRADEDDVDERVREAVRSALLGSPEEARASLEAVRFDTWAGRKAARRVCKLLQRRTDWPESKTFHQRAAQWLAETWMADRRSQPGGERDYGGENELSQSIVRFALKLPETDATEVCAPLMEAVIDEPREVANFVHCLVVGADGGADDSFWALWQGFADRATDAPWINGLDRERSYAAPLVNRLFLTTNWKKGTKHWPRLDDEALRVHSLAQRLPTSAACVEAYLRFLYTVGQQSLPDAFKNVDSVLQRGDAVRIASGSEIAFYLESLLGRFVYAQPHRLKIDPVLRNSVLRLLDVLVLAGSSAAYRMRDDFVTPVRLQSA